MAVPQRLQYAYERCLREAYTDVEALLWLAAYLDLHRGLTEQQLVQAVAVLTPQDREAVIAFVRARPKGLKLTRECT